MADASKAQPVEGFPGVYVRTGPNGTWYGTDPKKAFLFRKPEKAFAKVTGNGNYGNVMGNTKKNLTAATTGVNQGNKTAQESQEMQNARDSMGKNIGGVLGIGGKTSKGNKEEDYANALRAVNKYAGSGGWAANAAKAGVDPAQIAEWRRIINEEGHFKPTTSAEIEGRNKPPEDPPKNEDPPKIVWGTPETTEDIPSTTPPPVTNIPSLSKKPTGPRIMWGKHPVTGEEGYYDANLIGND